MYIDSNSFEQKYGMNIRYEDFIPGLYHLVKINIWKTSEYFTQLVSISCNPLIFIDNNMYNSIGPYPFVIYREDKNLFQVRTDGSKVKLWCFENGQIPIEILLENYRNNIR